MDKVYIVGSQSPSNRVLVVTLNADIPHDDELEQLVSIPFKSGLSCNSNILLSNTHKIEILV